MLKISILLKLILKPPACFARLVFLCCLFTSSFSFAAAYPATSAPSGDNNYYIYEAKDYRIIFDEQYKNNLPQIVNKINHYTAFMRELQGASLETRPNLILFSDKKQISNALASLFPFSQIQINSTGVSALDFMSFSRWLDGVFFHELNHIYQLSHSSMPKFFRKTLKTPGGILYGILFFAFPNQFLPNVFTEGDAVFKESLLNQGGRLQSGYVRAFVYSQIKYYQNNRDQWTERAINQTPEVFSGSDKYFHGGYLFSALAEKYSIKTLNQFFQINPIYNFIFPGNFNPSLVSAFDMDIHELTDFYFSRYGTEAYLQKSSSRSALFKSAVCPPFNYFGDNVAFLTSNLKSEPFLRVYNTKTKKWTKKRIDLPIGKLFNIDGVYYSRSSSTIRPHVIQYSLFSEGFRGRKEFHSKYVEDIKNQNILYIDAKNNIDGFKLFLNDRFYDNVNSNSLFGPEGGVYYFKQEGLVRTLYKNKQRVFSYRGFYGRLLHIDKEGAIYFTGSTPYGSSIYVHKNGVTFRASLSDTISRAVVLGNDEFLVCEITPKGYEYKTLFLEKTDEEPAFYRYHYKDTPPAPAFYEKDDPPAAIDESFYRQEIEGDFYRDQTRKSFEFFEEEQTKTTNDDDEILLEEAQPQPLTRELDSSGTAENLSHSADESQNTDLSFKKYYPFLNIRFSGLKFRLSVDQKTTAGAVDLILTDALQKNYLSTEYSNINLFIHRAAVFYENRSYRLRWSGGYRHAWIQDYFFETENIKDIPITKNKFYGELAYPLFASGRWSSTIALNAFYYDELLHYKHPSAAFFKIKIPKNSWLARHIAGGGASWSIGYFKDYSLEPFANKASALGLGVQYSADVYESLDQLKWTGVFQNIYSLGYGFYFLPSVYHSSIAMGGFDPISTSLYPYIDDIFGAPNSTAFHSRFASRLKSTGSFNINAFSQLGLNLYSTSASVFSFDLKKSFYTPFYFKTIPFSVLRLIPLFRYKYIILEYPKTFKRHSPGLLTKGAYTDFMEWSAGIEIQLLAFYQAPISISITAGVSYPSQLLRSINYDISTIPHVRFMLRSPF